MKSFTLALCRVAVLALPIDADSPRQIERDQASIVLERIVQGLGIPWGLAFISNSLLLITEREGHIKLFDTRSKRLTRVQGAPDVLAAATVSGKIFVTKPLE